jgi:hypothetical protein
VRRPSPCALILTETGRGGAGLRSVQAERGRLPEGAEDVMRMRLAGHKLGKDHKRKWSKEEYEEAEEPAKKARRKGGERL